MNFRLCRTQTRLPVHLARVCLLLLPVLRRVCQSWVPTIHEIARSCSCVLKGKRVLSPRTDLEACTASLLRGANEVTSFHLTINLLRRILCDAYPSPTRPSRVEEGARVGCKQHCTTPTRVCATHSSTHVRSADGDTWFLTQSACRIHKEHTSRSIEAPQLRRNHLLPWGSDKRELLPWSVLPRRFPTQPRAVLHAEPSSQQIDQVDKF